MSVSALLSGILDINVQKITTSIMESINSINIKSSEIILDGFITLKGKVITENNPFCALSNTGPSGSITINSIKYITPHTIIMLTAIGSGINNENLTYIATTMSFTVYGPINQDFAYSILQF